MVFSWSLVAVGWFAWFYPFLFRAPHKQERESVTVPGPTRLGLLLECAGIFLAFVFREEGPVDGDHVARLAWRVGREQQIGVARRRQRREEPHLRRRGAGG